MTLIKNFKMNIFAPRCQKVLQNIKKVHLRQQSGSAYEEIKIPVPWGHIAGKWWGPQDQRPILCLHGWQESCGSFDPLLKILTTNSNTNSSYLAIDLPGHGYSSHLPKGWFYHIFDGPILLRRLQNYFGWEKMSFLSHSMGGFATFLYASLFAENVDLIMFVEALKPFSKEPGTAIKSSRRNIDKFLKYEMLNDSKTQPPVYNMSELTQKIYEGTKKSLLPKNAHYVLKRVVARSENDPNKYYFKRDHRLKAGTIIGMQHLDILEYAKQIKCPLILIKANTQSFYEPEHLATDFINTLKRNNNNFEYIIVEGTHHVHVNNPEIIATILLKFLDKYYTKDLKSDIRIQH